MIVMRKHAEVMHEKYPTAFTLTFYDKTRLLNLEFFIFVVYIKLPYVYFLMQKDRKEIDKDEFWGSETLSKRT